MVTLKQCRACSGFHKNDASACPHCGAGLTGSSPILLRALGVMAAVGGTAFAMTLMACYGAPPHDPCPAKPDASYDWCLQGDAASDGSTDAAPKG
jgi:hypothetical protein